MNASDTIAMRVARSIQSNPRAPRMPSDLDARNAESVAIEWLRGRVKQEKADAISVGAPLSSGTTIDVLAEFGDGSSLAIEAGVVQRPSNIDNAVDRAMRFLGQIPRSSMSLLFVVFLPERLGDALRSRLASLTLHTGFVLLTLPLGEPSGSMEPNRRAIPEASKGESGGNDNGPKSTTAPNAKDEPESHSPKGAAPSQPPRPPESQDATVRPEVLSDDAIASAADDRLGFRRYAEAIYALIDGKNTKTPLTVAIHAPWGSGKTSLARLIEEQAQFRAFGGTKPHKVLWFNAWLHDEGNAVHASFVSALARFCDEQRPLYVRCFSPLSANLLSVHERRNRRVTLTLGFFALSVLLLLVFAQDLLATLPNVFLGELKDAARASAFAKGGILVALAAAIPFAYSNLTKSFTEIGAAMGSFVLDPKLEAQTASLKMVRKELSNLVRSAVPPGSRLIVIVDDLERCRPPGCIDLLEGMSQLFEQEDMPIVFIVLADMTALSAAATVKYETLSKHYTPTTSGGTRAPSSHHFGRMYLEKLITLQFDLPQVPHTALVDWTTKLEAVTQTRGIIDDLSLPTVEWAVACAQDINISARKFIEQLKRRPHLVIDDRARRSKPVKIIFFKKFYFFVSGIYIFLALRGLLKTRFNFMSGFLIGNQHVLWGTLILMNLALWLSLIASLASILAGNTLSGAISIFLAALVFGILPGLKVSYLIRQKIQTWKSEEKHPSEILKIYIEKIADRTTHSIKSENLHFERRLHEEFAQDSGGRFGLARKTALTFVRSRPRSLKRMINRLRLAIYLTQDQDIDPVSLGKWTALQENWPGLAHAITGDEKPSNSVSDLESGEASKCEAALKSLAPGLTLSDGLKEFLASQPKLAPKIDDLVRLSAS